MRSVTRRLAVFVFALAAGLAAPVSAQQKGAAAIRADDMKFHVQFLGSADFRGRNMPSPELEIASRYIALTAARLGLKPLMPDGSFFQEMPLDVTTVSASASHLAVSAAGARTTFSTPAAFTVRGRWIAPATASGSLLFLGLGANAPALGWDDFAGLDLKGRVVVILDATLPASHALREAGNRALVARRATLAREKGAAAILTVIPPEREAAMAKAGLSFDNPDRGRPTDSEIGLGSVQVPAVFQVDVRHDAAAALLGVSRAEIDQMFERLGRGERVAPRDLPGRAIDVVVSLESRKGAGRNVVGWIEGTDPVLKGEYIVIGSHHDGIGYREGTVFAGADDNISGVVGMFSIARALAVERPRRSVIFVWHTGEEKGLLGAYYFVSHSPVPVEKITADLNLDMISRNDPDSIFLIGSNKLSSELDATINAVAKKVAGMGLDYKYEAASHPDRFFFRSDQYPYIRYGIPGVWFFCGTTDDYHQANDVEERIDYTKMEKVTRLVYLTVMEIGNRPALLKLDLDPRVTTRGPHNLKVAWQ
jgi:Zn-dependent M28 family amino/carboxypeptidase